jgi:transglutaminase-like putative cysteine protease
MNFFVVLSICLLVVVPTAAKPSFTIKPAPAWIKPVEAKARPEPGDRPSSILLDDKEVRLSEKTVERFYRHVESVDKAPGLQTVSKLQFEFEPSYQSLAIHFIKIIRGGQTIEALRPAEIKVIQKEDDLNEQLYNGTTQAVIFLNDVRVGDVVDYAYTVTGNNPVFGGRFSDGFYLADSEPVQTLRIRILAPGDRPLHFGNSAPNAQPKVSPLGKETEYFWERSDVPAVDIEDSTPGWFNNLPWVAVSEFQDWPAVVQWALPLYQVNEPLATEVKAKSDGWLNQLPRPEQRMIAALRFVQQEIRYLGIELGSYSHQPNPPSRTLARRFGDCKDKSLLLAAILSYMHIDNAVALVNTDARHAIADWQPSPQAFDHVIVRARVGEKTYWLDATNDSQRGDFEHYYELPYERALVLRADTSGLETIPALVVNSPTTLIREHYAIRNDQSPASLTVTSTYRGPDADDQRQWISRRSVAETGKSFVNYYAQDIPSIRSDGPLQIQDDADSDTLVVTEKYIIDSWETQDHYLRGDLVIRQLPVPNVSQRSMPLAISHPTFVTQIIEIDLPDASTVASPSEVISDDAFRFEYRSELSPGALILSYTLQTLRDSVPPQKVAAYLAKVDRIRNSTGLQLPRNSTGFVVRTNPGVSGGWGFQALALCLTGGIIAIALVVVRLRRRREETTRFSSLAPQPGGAPGSAFRCREASDIETFSRRFKCRCGAIPFKPEAMLNQESLVYDGERLATLKLKCQSCGRATDLYFVQPLSPPIPDQPPTPA